MNDSVVDGAATPESARAAQAELAGQMEASMMDALVNSPLDNCNQRLLPYTQERFTELAKNLYEEHEVFRESHDENQRTKAARHAAEDPAAAATKERAEQAAKAK